MGKFNFWKAASSNRSQSPATNPSISPGSTQSTQASPSGSRSAHRDTTAVNANASYRTSDSSSLPPHSTSRTSLPGTNTPLIDPFTGSSSRAISSQNSIVTPLLLSSTNRTRQSSSSTPTSSSRAVALPSSPPPVTLTWQPPEMTSTTERGSSTPDVSTDEVREDPPSYEIARNRLPERSITYTLSTIGQASSAGLLLPPPTFPDTRPLYYIAVCNSFLWPNCLVTSLFRGSSAEGQYVGGFSTVLAVYPHRADLQTFSKLQTVTYGLGKEVPTKQLFELSGTSHAVYVFSWRVQEPSKALVWECPNWPLAGKGSIRCSHLLSPKVAIAHYAPHKRLTNLMATHPPPEPLLTVTPQGHKYLDDIVLSLLLVERERLTFVNRIATF